MLKSLVIFLRLNQKLLMLRRGTLSHDNDVALATVADDFRQFLLRIDGGENFTIRLDDSIATKQLLAVQTPFHVETRRVWFHGHGESTDGHLDRVQRQIRTRLQQMEQRVRRVAVRGSNRFLQSRLKCANLFHQRQQLQLFAAQRVLQLCLSNSDVDIATGKRVND